MRITYRTHHNLEYWTRRWDAVAVDDPMENLGKYPLKYAVEATSMRSGSILEAGCGSGRILRYFHQKGFEITGVDFVPSVISRLKDADDSLVVMPGDIMDLDFENESFDVVLAYGLYHNLQISNFKKALIETYRVMKSGGLLSASCRADNIENRINDWYANKRSNSNKAGLKFHKINLSKKEFKGILQEAGFEILTIDHVENMPILYKFRFFRHPQHKNFDENKGRREGYRLSSLGSLIQKLLMKVAPSQFCNVNVILARKKGGC